MQPQPKATPFKCPKCGGVYFGATYAERGVGGTWVYHCHNTTAGNHPARLVGTGKAAHWEGCDALLCGWQGAAAECGMEGA